MSDSLVVTNRSDVRVGLPNTTSQAHTSGSLVDLHRCVVDVRRAAASVQPFAALTVRNVHQSLLICGTISGATHITTLRDSVIVVSTYQFRMHECQRCTVYLQVNSRPVIENCSEIQFSPLPDEFVSSMASATRATL